MVHFKEKDEDSCIFGAKLEGGRNKFVSEDSHFIKIRGFICKVVAEHPEKHMISTKDLSSFTKQGHNIGDGISGRRGIIQPVEGYKGPKAKTNKKPPKRGTHDPAFLVEGSPALCYFDNMSTREKKLKLKKIYKK